MKGGNFQFKPFSGGASHYGGGKIILMDKSSFAKYHGRRYIRTNFNTITTKNMVIAGVDLLKIRS